jgi:ABC-2 type transport system permease protein
MGPWRLEMLRVWRTRRLIALAAIFLIIGLGNPVLVYYLPDLLKGASDGIQITLTRQTPADGITGFAQSVAQLGTIVVVIVTAATLSIDARPGLAEFYRTRLRRPTRLVLPRYLTITGAAVAAFAVGTLGAWYETTILLGHISLADLAAGSALEALWLCFVTSVVAACTSVIRSVLGAVGSAVALLLALDVLGAAPALSSWMPTRLAESVADLTSPQPAGNIWHGAVIAGLAAAALISLAVNRIGRREL